MAATETPRPGLRARKRAKTLARIQSEALRLFASQGYAATTVIEIAEAAEVSESTFFRYFRSKEDVVLLDDLDPVFVESLRAQPTELSPVEAVRRALKELFEELSGDERAQSRERFALIFSVPELRARMLDQLFAGTALMTRLIAERMGNPDDHRDARILAGAVIGVAIAAMASVVDDPRADLHDLMDDALDRLQAGLAW